MKKLSFLSLFLLVLGSSAFASDGEPYFTKTFRSANIKLVDVETSGGGITVTGGNEQEARVEVYVRSNDWPNQQLSKQELESRLSNYDLDVSFENGVVTCVAKRKSTEKWSWKNGLSISFKVFVPTQVDTKLTTSGGSIALKNLNGNLEFTTSGGGLALDGLQGKINGRTSGGGIAATNCDGTISLRTSGGGLTLNGLSGNIKATTSGGGIKASNVRGSLNTSTSGGSIQLDGIEGSVAASTSGGGIRASITKPKDFVTLSTSAGSVNVDLPNQAGLTFQVKGNSIDFKDFGSLDGMKSKDSMSGSVNGGGVAVKITTSAGSVRIY